jgi:bifunctional non-homologous end joining protein LigD
VITHPEKVLFPAVDGHAAITKGELAAYYESVAPLMVPHVRGRPITMERYPAGIGAKGFFQKDVVKGFPEWLERVEVPKKGGSVHHPLISDTRSLLWVTNQNNITPHVWTSRVPALYQPDICVFDLDPATEDAGVLRGAALALRDLLEELGFPSWVKTSGSKGFHIVVPLDAKSDFGDVAAFAHGVGAVLVRRNPKDLTQEFHKADRGGRILVDTARNAYGATFAAPYAVRARAGAPVSVPCTWKEIEDGHVGPRTFDLGNVRERLAETGDLWNDLRRRRRSLRPAMERLRRLQGADAPAPPPATLPTEAPSPGPRARRAKPGRSSRGAP